MAAMGRLERAAWSASVLTQAGLVRPYLPDQLLGMGLALRRYGLSAASLYAVGAAQSSRRPALVDEQGSLSYGELDDRTGNVAADLAERGVVAGDRVGVLCRNHRGFVEATVGLSKVGAQALLLNTGMAGPQLAQVVAREGASSLLLDEEFLATADGLGPGVPRIVAEEIAWAAGGRR
ncbi:MAG: hypothetical protein QOF20_2535, partial [Acidimicrobiaceae bacterium]|nr:hypothetical protein [Acidimicrobiaceae bacterium]